MQTDSCLSRPLFTVAIVVCGVVLFLGAHKRAAAAPQAPAVKDHPGLAFPGEKHLKNIRQLTFGGTNAEAYFSIDDKYITFQHQGQFYDPKTGAAMGPNIPCDQIYTMAITHTSADDAGHPTNEAVSGGVTASAAASGAIRMLSNGKGRTTCSYFFPNGERILYSSTFAATDACPPLPDYSHGYVWPIYDTLHDLYREARWQRHSPALESAGLQRRVHHHARRQAHRVHLHAQRRPRHLHHGRRRQRT